MHLACAFLEGKDVHPVGPKDIKEGTVRDMPSDHLQPDMSMDEDLPEETAESSESGTCSWRPRIVAAAGVPNMRMCRLLSTRSVRP